ncbi:MAG: hypothetical protein ABIV06_03820 [Thermoanaerobaculia bacterium]
MEMSTGPAAARGTWKWSTAVLLNVLLVTSGCLKITWDDVTWAEEAGKALEQRRWEDAKGLLDRVDAPRRNHVWYEFAYAASTASLTNEGKVEIAGWFETALKNGEERSPEDPYLSYKYAKLLQALGRPEEAEKKFETARELAESMVGTGAKDGKARKDGYLQTGTWEEFRQQPEKDELLRSAEWVLEEVAKRKVSRP